MYTTPTFWLRLSYWTGAIVDLLAALQMLSPALFAFSSGLSDFNPPTEYTYALGMGASFMLGWTVLLLWADRKPLERKGILLITVAPVILGMVVNEVRGIYLAFLPFQAAIPLFVGQTILASLFLFSYVNASRVN